MNEKSYIDSDKALEYVSRQIVNRLNLVGGFIVAETAVRCPVNTGNLRSSYKFEVHSNDLFVRIGTGVFYAPHVEFGTQAHFITPKNPDGVLAFINKDKKLIFTKWVAHPGTKSVPHLRPAVYENKDAILNILNGKKV